MIVSPRALWAIRELTSWTWQRRTRFRVTGASMVPTLRDGDFVLVDPTAPVAVGDLVLAEHPDGELLVVKRLVERFDDGRVAVRSDNPAGSDSRTWGPLPETAIRGRVSLILNRPFDSTDTTTDSAETGARPPRPGGVELRRWLRR